MSIGRPAGRTPQQLAKASQTKRRARQFERAMSAPPAVLGWSAPRIAHCIGCGCHDYDACHDEATGGPCSWLSVDYEAKRGVCSACPDDVARWNAGDRELAAPIDCDQ
jgi:hypothetical protein